MRTLHDEMITAARTTEDFRGLAAMLDRRARRFAAVAQPEPLRQAALLLGATGALGHRPEMPSSDPLDLWQRGRVLATVHAALDEAVYMEAWTEGETLAGDPEALGALLDLPLPPAAEW
jgi:hypothetical protein